MTTAVGPLTEVSTWSLDPAHSRVHFKVRHMMLANVRGEFRELRADLHLDEADITRSSVSVDIDASSIETRNIQRDDHLRSADFLDAARYPTIFFRSTRIQRMPNGGIQIAGELTIRGIALVVNLDVDNVSPAMKDPWGNFRMAASASTSINRKDFGLTWNAALETGGVLVGDEVSIELELEFLRDHSSK